MASEEDVMRNFREDACFTIYSLIADALFRCTTEPGATHIIVKICSLPPSNVPSLPPMYLFSVAHSGPGIKTAELRNCFPRFSKSCYSNASSQLGLRWGGVVRVLTADAEDEDFRHYEIVMRSDSRYETIQLPCTEYDTELDSGTICEIIVAGSVHVLVDFSRSICEKTSMLKLKNITLDFFLEGVHTDDSGHHIKGLRIFDGIQSLDYSAEELLCDGAVECLSSCRCGFSEGSIADLRFRELVQVGKGQAGSRETKWCLDACVALIDAAMAEEISATIGPQTSVIAYFEDGCYTPAPVSVTKGLSSVQWAKFGLKMKDMQTADSGEVIMQFEESRRISTMFMILHIHQNLKTPRRSKSPAGGKMVKTAVETCMTDLKARHSQHFLTENGIQMQQVATDVSECIASIIFSSTNENFREQCASIVDLPLHDLGEIESLIRAKMIKIIQQHDGRKKRKSGANDTARLTSELALGEDGEADPLYHEDEVEEFL